MMAKLKVIQVSSSQCQYGSGACLTEDALDFLWYDSLPKDDVESTEKYLNSVGERRKAELLHGHICASKTGEMITEVKGLNLTLAKMMYSQVMPTRGLKWPPKSL